MLSIAHVTVSRLKLTLIGVVRTRRASLGGDPYLARGGFEITEAENGERNDRRTVLNEGDPLLLGL